MWRVCSLGCDISGGMPEECAVICAGEPDGEPSCVDSCIAEGGTAEQCEFLCGETEEPPVDQSEAHAECIEECVLDGGEEGDCALLCEALIL